MINYLFKSLIAAVLLFFSIPVTLQAQEWMNIYHSAQSAHWMLPIHVDSIDHADFSADDSDMLIHLNDGFAVPMTVSAMDSIGFFVPDEAVVKDKYQVFQMFVYTEDQRAIDTKDYYIPCYIGVNGLGHYGNRWVHGGIRGRGNSSWLYYDKKPYRIKLDTKQKMLGMDKAKSWVLLSNYRDMTDMMNTYVFELGRMMGLPFTNHTRYVELFVNGKYIGVYQLTEQVQQNKSRVDVSDERGILISLDRDDGPEYEPSATDNFWSSGYNLPVAVKYPDDDLLTADRRDSIQEVFAELETAIKTKDYATASQLMDMGSFARYLIIQEFIYNVELDAPRSIFMHKDGDGPWVMGPLWDFDAAFDFSWDNWTKNHSYFSSYRKTVMGTNPYKRNGNYPNMSKFFTDLFGTHEFVKLYKDTWRHYADSIVSRPWQEVEAYVNHLRQGAMKRDAEAWPLRWSFETELGKMKAWLENRRTYMDNLIENIPEPAEVVPVTDEQVCGTIDVFTTMQWYDGYNQGVKVEVDRSKVLQLLGVSEAYFKANLIDIVPLNTDGTEGANNTKGTYGGWFNGDNNPRVWDGGHVYIEVYNDLFNWTCGIRTDTCYDEEHTVTMQYRCQAGTTIKKVNVRVHFTIESYWW